MKILLALFFILIGISFGAQAGSGKRSPYVVDRFGNELIVGDIVKFPWRDALIGTVLSFSSTSRKVDIDWNDPKTDIPSRVPSHIVYKEPALRLLDSVGNAIFIGALVQYKDRYSQGTVERIDFERKAVDIQWNVQGSGYGIEVRAADLTVKR